MIVVDREKYDNIIESVWKIYVEETMFSSDPKWLEPIHLMNMKTGEKSIGARQFSKVGFIHKCKTDPEFSEKWGLKIEERELSLGERSKLLSTEQFHEYGLLSPFTNVIINMYLNGKNIPTKLITIEYNNEKIGIYE